MARQTTEFKLDGQTVSVRYFGKEKQYVVKEITAIAWNPCKGMIGKKLDITFTDGKTYSFEMDGFCGVQNMFNTLQELGCTVY